MRAVIISGGTITDYEYIKSQIDRNGSVSIICADSGYRHAFKMGLVPCVVVGDFDSVAETEIPDDVPCIRHPSKKDLTDTEIAVEYAREQGFRDFLLLGATGSRMDHTLANILLLKSFVNNGENAVVLDEHNKIMLTDSKLQFSEAPGSFVSLIPLTDCYGVTTENLEYPLENATMTVGKGLGVSNIMAKHDASVSVKDGLLLVIVAKD